MFIPSSRGNIIKYTQNTTIPVSTYIITVHNSIMLLHNLGRETLSKPLLIISEGCCSLPENVSDLKSKYVTVHGELTEISLKGSFVIG